MSENKHELLVTAVEYAQKLTQGIMQAAQCYRESEIAKGHEYVGMITEGIEWLINAVVLVQDLLIESIDVTAINDLIAEYIEAVENDDIVLMADLLEYEIAETIQAWYGILEETIQKNVGMGVNEA